MYVHLEHDPDNSYYEIRVNIKNIDFTYTETYDSIAQAIETAESIAGDLGCEFIKPETKLAIVWLSHHLESAVDSPSTLQVVYNDSDDKAIKVDVDGWNTDQLEELFSKQGITRVYSLLGHTSSIQGDLPDGIYDVGTWLEWYWALA